MATVSLNEDDKEQIAEAFKKATNLEVNIESIHEVSNPNFR